MKFKTWTVGIAVLALSAAPAFAQENLGQWSYDAQVKPVGCDSGCDCGDGCGCGSSVCGGGGLFSGIGCGCLEGFTMAGALGVSNYDVGGWTQFGYHDQQTPLSTARGDAAAFNDVPQDVNLHQQWFFFGKEADGSDGLGFGFRSDFIYGTDAQKTQAFSNPAGSFDEDWDHGVYGWALPQLYGEVAMGDMSVKVGKFFTLVGYEVVPATGNFFYSHALTMFNSEPFTHTGVLGTYDGFENMTLYGGWTLGWDTGFDQVNSGNSFLGGFAVNLLDAVSMTYINTYGNFGAISAVDADSDYSHSLVFDVTLTDRLNYVLQTDYLGIEGAGGVGITESLGANQYLFWEYNDIVSFGTRLEWWRNDGVSNNALTTGVNIKLLDNLIIRPEARHDWVPSTGFDEGMCGCDMILTY